MKELATLDLRSREEWRNWLRERHADEAGIWLVFHKHAPGCAISYEDAVEEALCFGWIDSLVKRLDDNRYARKFTPRKAGSKWSTINRRRYAGLQARGLLAPAGVGRAPTERSGDAPRPNLSAIPPYIEARLKSDARAWSYFEQLSPSCRRAYIGWIDSAQRRQTREKRLTEAAAMLAARMKLGMK